MQYAGRKIRKRGTLHFLCLAGTSKNPQCGFASHNIDAFFWARDHRHGLAPPKISLGDVEGFMHAWRWHTAWSSESRVGIRIPKGIPLLLIRESNSIPIRFWIPRLALYNEWYSLVARLSQSAYPLSSIRTEFYGSFMPSELTLFQYGANSCAHVSTIRIVQSRW